MITKKPNKQVVLDSIIKDIEQGVPRRNILATVGGKWRIAPRTFDRYWKTANEQHAAKQQIIKKEIEKVDKAEAVMARKRQIADANERKEVLTKIMRGQIKLKKPMAIGSKLKMITVTPDWMDRKNAIAELNKMEGDYAATKGEFIVSGFLDYLKETSDE